MREFAETFPLDASVRVLDIGGTTLNWTVARLPLRVTLLNVHPAADTRGTASAMQYVQGDGTSLEYEDGAFDICFSNSTIEHVHTWERQQAFAREMRRVGRGVWMQTPAREFFFEPHWLSPFIHWLPKSWQRRLGRNFTIYGLTYRPTHAQVSELVDEYRLLTYEEVRDLFPDCEIRRERFLGFTKSYVAVRPLEQRHP